MLSRVIASPRHVHVILAAICVVGGVLVLSCGLAQARLLRPNTGSSFGPAGPGAGVFGEVKSIAVDQGTGDVYIFDKGAEAIDKFTANGEPVDFSSTGTNEIKGVESAGGGAEQQIAVDSSKGPAKGDIYLANNQVVEIYSAAGVKLGELTGGEACGVAVDSSGNVYVGFYPSTVVKYVPAANPVTNADDAGSLRGLSGICNVAADSEGDVYAASYGLGVVHRYTAMQFGAIEAEGTLIDEGSPTIAVDLADGNVFADQRSRVAEYDASATLESVAGEDELENSLGIAYSQANGDTYTANAGRVEAFGAVVVLPDAITEAATSVAPTSATLNGSVDPDGTATSYQFEYGTSTSYGSKLPMAPTEVGSDSTVHSLLAHLTGLARSSTYHYRIAATNANGSSYGEDQTFETPGPPTIEFSEVQRAESITTELVAAVNPRGFDTHVYAEYGTSEAYGAVSASTDIGSQEVATNPELTGLTSNTTYHARIVATNAEGTVYGPDIVFRTEPPFTVSDESADTVHSTSANVSARIDDYKVASTYRFEYGTTNAYGSTTAPTTLDGSEQTLEATASLRELMPSTTYHFRVVAESSVGIERGPDVSFTTEPVAAPSLTLPDGRGYEKVSSNENADADVYQDVPLELSTQAGHTEEPFVVAPEGDAVAYIAEPSEHGGSGREGGGFGDQYLATRQADGHWNSANITPASAEFRDVPVFSGFSPDLSVGFVNSISSSALAEDAPGEGFSVLYAKTFSTGSYQALVRTRPEHRGPEEFGSAQLPSVEGKEVRYEGSSTGLGHELFMANDTLGTRAVDGGEGENNLFDSSGGTTTLVNVLPDGSTEANATFGGPYAEQESRGANYPILAHDISEDGSKIFWTDLNTHNLYVRENDTAPESPIVGGVCSVPGDACTRLIAEDAQFWNATPDGSKVLYTQGGDLYEYDLINGQRLDRAPDASMNGVVAASEDLSYVYFVAKAALAPGAGSVTCEEGESAPESSLCNLYVVHDGEAIRFIGALHTHDNIQGPESFSEHDGDWQGSLSNTEAEATPDGAHLLFSSKSHLTGYESKASEQEFLYDYDAGRLSCISCKPNGEAISDAYKSAYYSAYLPVSRVSTARPHWMTDSGNELFFDSIDSLVPQDTNHKTDVYEWERDGSGSCSESPGCIYMLSDGTSPEGSYLIGASTDGDDVFFTTRGKMTPEDNNENIDVYDARVGAVNPPAPPKCTGSGCQGVPSTPPIFATPPSVTYNGVGNFAASRAPASNKAKPLTRAQKLAKALKACKSKSKKKRPSCKKQARKRYGKQRSSSASRRRTSVKRPSGRGK